MYAPDWKVIGTLLGIPNEELKAIEGGYPTNLKWCCNRMLEKWLEIDPTASLEKLFTAIQSPAVSGTHGDNGKSLISCILDYLLTFYNVMCTPLQPPHFEDSVQDNVLVVRQLFMP